MEKAKLSTQEIFLLARVSKILPKASLRTLSLIKQPWNIDEDRKNNKLIPLSYHYLTS